MKSKKIYSVLVVLALFVCSMPLFCQEKSDAPEQVLQQYFNQNFHGNMMGKIITADMEILDGETIQFTANLPAGKKQHTYSYKIVSSSNGILTEWYENGKLDKTVTFSDFGTDSFVMEVKGKGKVKMQKTE